jgi:hypothetical protein
MTRCMPLVLVRVPQLLQQLQLLRLLLLPQPILLP